MAYSNVGTPIFYIDNYLYRKTIGVVTHNSSFVDTDTYPSSEVRGYSDKTNPNIVNMSPSFSNSLFGNDDSQNNIQFAIPSRNLSEGNNVTDFNLTGNLKIYCAILNHNFTFIDFIVAIGGSISTVLMIINFFGSYFMYNQFIKKLAYD